MNRKTDPQYEVAEDGLPLPRRYWALLTISTALAMVVMDTNIANIALPTISRELHVGAADTIWVVNAYQLAVMICLMPFASLGDSFGYKRIYLVGLTIFTLASLACALSDTLTMLTLSRVVQGVGGSAIMAVNTALVRFSFPRKELGRGIGMIAMVVATSSALGPTVAALILSVASWQWLFAINLPLGIAALLLALRFLPLNKPLRQPFDFTSGVLSAVAIGSLITGIDGIGHGEGAWLVLAELAIAGIFGYAFVRRQQKLSFPMLPVDLFKRPVFALSVASSVCSFVAQGSAFVALPFFFQDILGRSQVQTGLLVTPWPVTVAFVAPVAGRLADRYPAGILGGLGLASMSLGLILMALLPADPSNFDIIWRMVICGFGFALFQSPNNRAVVGSVPRERSGSAGAIQSTARLFGQTNGAALVAVVFGILTGPRGVPGYAVTLAILIGAGFAATGALTSTMRLVGRRQVPVASTSPVAVGDRARAPGTVMTAEVDAATSAQEPVSR